MSSVFHLVEDLERDGSSRHWLVNDVNILKTTCNAVVAVPRQTLVQRVLLHSEKTYAKHIIPSCYAKV